MIKLLKRLTTLWKFRLEYQVIRIVFLKVKSHHDAVSVKDKLSSISGLKGITSPMKQTAGGWVPNFGDRYFLEDFGFSLRYIYLLARKHGIATPNIDKVYLWGLDKIKSR